MTGMGRIADASMKATLAAAQSEAAYLKERYAAALERERLLLGQLSALKWQPITPENLPKVGDEVLRKRMGVSGELHVATESVVFSDTNIDDYKMLRCTHFRPINPPQDVEKS